jgi:hypothetical protein
MLLLLSCAAPDVWPRAAAACDDFTAGCQAVLSADFGLSASLTGLPEIGLLEGLWRMVGLPLGSACPDWARSGESGAACLYNAAAAAVEQSDYDADAGYLTLSGDALLVGDDMGYFSALRVPIGLAGALAGACGEQWVGDAGLPYCEGDDCLVLLEASAAEGCP